jgi:GH15 family glucan-1,4-alpha-glucosidase
VRSQVFNASKFFLAYPVPTVAADSPQFNPIFTVNLMWRGPSWGFTTWFVIEGLLTHGYELEARVLLDRWIDLVRVTGIWEHWNPITGEPYGVEGLGMSTLITDMLYRFNIVQ